MEKKTSGSKGGVPKTVNEYLARLPKSTRDALERLRKTIKSAAPKATEVISYQIPVYKYGGRPLVGFAAYKNHYGFYLMSFAIMKAFDEEVKNYRSSKFTLQFPVDEPVPLALVKKLVKARIAEVDARPPQAATKLKLVRTRRG
ncbi:MAG TPA: DUF1801 domain-containing protein [Pyrinomonadaceae bacterium]|nr:DUF1801 domain-containing protein [Pyrinomonadaceae bacterium]